MLKKMSQWCLFLGFSLSASLAMGSTSQPSHNKTQAFRAIQSQKRSLLPCYKHALKKKPRLRGTFTVVFLVEKSGKVRKVTGVKSTLGVATLERCILGQLAKWRFSKSARSGIHKVLYPFTFTPGPPKKRASKVKWGRLSKKVIQNVIRSNRMDIRKCYERALEQKPTLKGRVIFAFTISQAGVTKMAQVKTSSLKHKKMESCLLLAVRKWRFPKPRGGGIVRVQYPFSFHP